jgi:hypothetical protein
MCKIGYRNLVVSMDIRNALKFLLVYVEHSVRNVSITDRRFCGGPETKIYLPVDHHLPVLKGCRRQRPARRVLRDSSLYPVCYCKF